MQMHLSKYEAATRQLTTAIQLLFEGRDPASIRTLIGASGRVFSDLVQRKHSGKSWREAIVQSNSSQQPREIYRILDKMQNFLKHADEDPDAVEVLIEQENDDLMFMACLECSNLGEPRTVEIDVFEIWYLSSYASRLDSGGLDKSWIVFPHLEAMGREERLRFGAKFLTEERTKNEEPSHAV